MSSPIRRLLPVAILTLSACTFFRPDPPGTYTVFVKTVPATRLAVIERPGKSYFTIGKDLRKLALSPLWPHRTGPLQATYTVDTLKEKGKAPNSEAALPVAPDAVVPAPFLVKEVPEQTVAYTFWRKDVFRGFKTFPSIEDWAEKNGWAIDGPPTEVYVTAGLPDEAAESVVEVRFPVRRK